MMSGFFPIHFSLTKTAAVLLVLGAVAAFDCARRVHHRPSHLLFACILGTVLSLGIINTARAFLETGGPIQPHAAALAVVFIALLWYVLFGPWEEQTKVTLLGTFLFWISLHLFGGAPPAERSVRVIAALVAFVPALLWCCLFLKYHRERLLLVALMFLSGMLATAPILFYDTLVRRGAELHFFLFQVKPESFNRSADLFVSGGLLGSPGLRSTVAATLLSFVLVALIEELSKWWVLKRSARNSPTSIDDVVQFAILIAIGFAFAENILNSSYFMGFVREYLLKAGGPDIAGFVSNVAGRSVLTSMVHIVSTGILGYFLGLALFAGPYVEREGGQFLGWVLDTVSTFLRVRREVLFRIGALTVGFGAAILLHSVFNFLVTLPDLLPGNPRTLGDLFSAAPGSPLHWVAILLFPSLFYVCGGFWVLTGLFLERKNAEEFGHPVRTEVFVR